MDTNVLLDVLARREPHFADSSQVWALAESGRIQGFVATVSFLNTYYIIQKVSGRAKAEEGIRLLRDIFEPVAVDGQILHQAMDSGLRDFEDAVQFYCAVRCQAKCLVTRNPSDFPQRTLPIVTPTEFLALLTQAR